MEQRAQSKHEKAEVLVVLSPILLVNREVWLADVTSRLMPGCTAGCHQQDFGFFDYSASFTEDGLLQRYGSHLTKRKTSLEKTCYLVRMALN